MPITRAEFFTWKTSPTRMIRCAGLGAALGIALIGGRLTVGGTYLCPIRTRVGPLDVRTDRPLTAENRAALDSALRRVARAGLTVRPNQRVYLATTPWHATALNTMVRREVRGSYDPFSRWVVIPMSNQPDPTLVDAGVMTHELTHAAMAYTLGYLAFTHLPWWKSEGSANYVEWHETEIAMARVLGGHGPSPRAHDTGTDDESFSYFWARVLVTTVLDRTDRPADIHFDLGRLLADTTSPVELTRRARRTAILGPQDWGVFLAGEADVYHKPDPFLYVAQSP